MHPATRIAACAVALTALTSVAHADVYKCAGEGKVPVYQEMPCASGKELRNFQTDPPEITILPTQPGQAGVAPAAKGATAVETKDKAAKDKVVKDAKPGKSALSGDASERKFVHAGMTEAEVVAKLGQPDMTTGARNSAVHRWTYLPAPGDAETITSVTLTKGTVTDVDRKVYRK